MDTPSFDKIERDSVLKKGEIVVVRQRSKKGRDSGGVAVYMRNDIAADMVTVASYSSGVIEMIGLYSKAKNLLLLVMYRQPDDIVGGHRSTNIEFKQALGKLEETLSSIKNPTPYILLCGDFNLPHGKWTESQPGPGAKRDERIMIEDLITLTDEYFLSQLIHKPTHKDGNTLDLLFTNNPLILHSYNVMENIFSHHGIVECFTTYNIIPHNKQEQPVSNKDTEIRFENLNFFSDDTDWERIDKELAEHNWESEFRASEPRQMLSKFLEICESIVAKYVPTRTKSALSQRKSHIPRDRKNLMRKRRRINVQLCKTTNDARRKKLKQEAREVEKQLTRSYQRTQQECERKAVNSIKRNSKYFFSYAKKFSSIKSGIGPFIDAAKELVNCPLKMAKMLSEQYSSAYSTPKEPMPEAKEIFPDIHSKNQELCNVVFDEEDIIEAIDHISPTAAAGPDRFPALLLKMCKHSLAKPLYLIWRRSMDTGEIPLVLKTANVVPIHKGGSRGEPANYRPVALTSHLIKVFERVLRKHIVAYMEENNLFNPGQHGFRSGRSCLSQLIAHFDLISQLLERNQNVDVVYLDFAKAFDKVDFLVTMRKLHSMGISGKLGQWIYSFLTNREQAVIVNGITGNLSEVKSGVPQGSVLGPLLFLVLISDIDHGTASTFISSFADDTRAAKGISAVEDVEALQTDLQAIYKWSQENNMEFNSPKFECLRYGNNNDIKETTCYKTPSGDPIKVVEHAKDLGIIMSCNGTFREHVNRVINTANQLCGWVLRTFTTRQKMPMLMLWKSLIRPKLEYCCQLWCPTQTGDIQRLEQVQRNFIRKISGVQHLSYWQQLKDLSMYSLEGRRERYTLIYIWKIMENKVPNVSHTDQTGIQWFWHQRRGRNCIVPTINLRGPQHFQTVRNASFGVRGPRLFNKLPARIRNITGCTVDTFKQNLDKYLSTVPDEPQIRGYTSMRRAESNSLLEMSQFATSQQIQLEGAVNATAYRGGHPWTPWT